MSVFDGDGHWTLDTLAAVLTLDNDDDDDNDCMVRCNDMTWQIVSFEWNRGKGDQIVGDLRYPSFSPVSPLANSQPVLSPSLSLPLSQPILCQFVYLAFFRLSPRLWSLGPLTRWVAGPLYGAWARQKTRLNRGIMVIWLPPLPAHRVVCAFLIWFIIASS